MAIRKARNRPIRFIDPPVPLCEEMYAVYVINREKGSATLLEIGANGLLSIYVEKDAAKILADRMRVGLGLDTKVQKITIVHEWPHVKT